MRRSSDGGSLHVRHRRSAGHRGSIGEDVGEGDEGSSRLRRGGQGGRVLLLSLLWLMLLLLPRVHLEYLESKIWKRYRLLQSKGVLVIRGREHPLPFMHWTSMLTARVRAVFDVPLSVRHFSLAEGRSTQSLNQKRGTTLENFQSSPNFLFSIF